MGFVEVFGGEVQVSKLQDDPTCTIYKLHFHIENTTSRNSGQVGPDARPVRQIWDWDEYYDPEKGKPKPVTGPVVPYADRWDNIGY